MPPRVLQLSACTVDLERGEVHRAGEVIALTELERAVLRHLAERPEQVVTREALLEQVWGWRASGETRAVDVAMRRLRDKLGEPGRGGHLRTVHGAGYRFSPPPTLALAPAPGLPLASDRFVGRQAELERVDLALRADRGLAIQGPPGVGKTRLALSYGAGRSDEYRGGGGVWWIPLREARSAEALVAAVAARLVVPLAGDDGAARVGAALAARGPLLLMLDNLEAIATASAPILSSWLARAPALRLLCTSQRPIAGLRGMALGPLPAPDAAALLLDRARAARPDFPEEAAPALAAALDHHPLALELAAGWARLLDPPAMLDRAQRAARGGGLEAALERSWALLAPEEAAALAALGVFRGEISAEAAEAVLGEGALGLIESLSRASLVAVAAGRARLLEVVRQRAERLLAEGPREAQVRTRHAAWLAERVAPLAERQLQRPDLATRAALEAERDNLAAALHPLVPPELRAPLAAALADVAESLGQEPAALQALRAVEDEPALPVDARRAVLTRLALLRARVGEIEAGERAAEALLALGDPRSTAFGRYARTLVRCKQGRLHDGVAEAEASLAAAEAAGEARLAGLALLERAVLASTLGQLEEAVSWYQRAREALQAAGDVRALARALCNLGLITGLLGRPEAEATLLGQARALLEDRGLPKDLANCELILATSLLEQGASARASELIEAAGRRVLAMGDPFTHLRYRLVAGEIARDAGRYAEAEHQLLAGLHEAERMEHQHYRGPFLRALGELYDTSGQLERAVGVYARALDACAGGRNPMAEAQVLGLLACLAADGDALEIAERTLSALPEDLDERPLRLAHLDLARARARPDEAPQHRAAAAERLRRARRGGPGCRFTVASSERLRSALRLLESRLRSDGALLRPVEPWVMARAVAAIEARGLRATGGDVSFVPDT